MIKNLLIKNFAIIEEISIGFDPGLTVITGETGSGKSIIIEALSVAAGKKTDRMMIKSGTENSIIDLDFIDDCYRRIISKSGRSKSYINEIPISINDLTKEFEPKIDFHGQHDQQLILKKENHIDYLDRFCRIEKLVQECTEVFQSLVSSKIRLKKIQENKSVIGDRKELLEFQINEIEQVSPCEDEDIELIYNSLAKGGTFLVMNLELRCLPTANGWKNDGIDIKEIIEKRFDVVEYFSPPNDAAPAANVTPCNAPHTTPPDAKES